ncbi:MAG: hypothetical protein R3F19_31360 [Verrucomicrobiales bacterium]
MIARRSILVLTHLALAGLAFLFGRSGTSDASSSPRQVNASSGFSLVESEPNVSAGEDSLSTQPDFVGRVGQESSRIDQLATAEVLSELKDRRYLPGNASNFLAQQLLLARYAALDPETALTFVDSMSGLDHEFGLQTVMQAWAADDPTAAAAYFVENRKDFGETWEDQGSVAGNLAAEWARQSSADAIEWATRLPKGLQGEVVARTIAAIAQEDPFEAANAALAMEPGDAQREGVKTLASQWAYQDPNAAAAWVQSSTEGKEQAEATASVTQAWMRDDPMGASAWVAALPEGSTKDAAILAMTESRHLRRDLEAAAVWSSAIQDERLRDELLRSVTTRWLAQDPTAARAWLETREPVP